MPITRKTKDKRYSYNYVFDRKRKTIVAKKLVNDFGGKMIKDITESDYKIGEQFVKQLSDDWLDNRKKFSNNLLDPFD